MKKNPINLHFTASLKDPMRRQAYTDAVFMSIGDGAIVTNEEGRIAQINQSALRILGLKEREAVGEWFQKIMRAKDEHGEDIDLMDRPITKAILTGQPVSARMYYATKKHNNIPVFVTVSPVMFKGKPHGAIEVFRDISHEEEVDRMKSEFISLASHQLRTPLTAITTYTHMLLKGFKGEVNNGQREFLETIIDSADRMNDLIDTLLNVSRLESGSVKVEIQDVNVSHILTKTKQELWPLAKNKSQFLITTAPDKDVHIVTDPLLFTEVCTNLISNAIKYTPAEGKINITLNQKSQNIELSVTDNGYGIPEALQGRVFSKFFRAPNILHEEAVGTGLGLYWVKQIIENTLGGSISFESTEGKGTTFTVRLPNVLEGEIISTLKLT
jgi:PAS domain S-box-containing protein